MEQVVLNANRRIVIGKQVKALRREGLMPAIIYGQGLDPAPISLNSHEASLILSGFSTSQLLVIDIEGDRRTVLVRDKQRDPVTGEILHADFLEVSMTEKLRTVVPIEITGEAPAVSSLGAILVTSAEELSIECLPGDLPEVVTVDISGLVDFGDVIYVRDLDLPDAVEVLSDLDEIVVQASVPTQVVEEEEEEEEELEEELGEEMEPEVIERGKKEEEEY